MRIIRKTYYGGSLKWPITITRKFWDEVTERRKYFEDNNKNNPTWPRVDTLYGRDEIGERPSLPDWFYNLFFFLIGSLSFISLLFLIYIFHRGY